MWATNYFHTDLLIRNGFAEVELILRCVAVIFAILDNIKNYGVREKSIDVLGRYASWRWLVVRAATPFSRLRTYLCA
jgi:hypothetical protein